MQCVFHSIRFKVNKDWGSAEPFFLCPLTEVLSVASSVENQWGLKLVYEIMTQGVLHKQKEENR